MSAFRNLERRKNVVDFHARAEIRVEVTRHDTAVGSDHTKVAGIGTNQAPLP
jgi:hypothetical protein